MPRRYNYDADDIGLVEYNGKILTDRAVGKLEDKDSFFGPRNQMAWYYGQYKACIYDTGFMDKVHAWIDEHATAPWYWYEQSTNHGHSVETGIWFSSEDDLAKFAAVWDGKGPERYPNMVFKLSKTAVSLNESSLRKRQAKAAVVPDASEADVMVEDDPDAGAPGPGR